MALEPTALAAASCSPDLGEFGVFWSQELGQWLPNFLVFCCGGDNSFLGDSLYLTSINPYAITSSNYRLLQFVSLVCSRLFEVCGKMMSQELLRGSLEG